ncbi:MAG: D-2-hydroxyacid dehydrogenase [Bacteroidota bacterium]|nr:D-2-hydroxyacid dehydrogenase [Bacteroidota bacterium]
MKTVLANDGISQLGIDTLESAGFEVITQKVAQEQLPNVINEKQISVLLVRSATKVRKELIDACPNLQLIGRGGVGMDNIDVDYAESKGIGVINTPAASSESVAELVFSHLFNLVRFVYDSNRQMPLEGDTKFKDLKKAYAKGQELKGKKLGIIGFGRIGQEVAKRAIGLGMEVIVNDKFIKDKEIELTFFDGQKLSFYLKTSSIETVLQNSDFITLHIPKLSDKAVIGEKEIKMMKDRVGIINAARGGVIDEEALIKAIEKGKVMAAGLDVFDNEPTPSIKLLMLQNVSLTPHIGAATNEAQNRIGKELADKIISHFE